MLKLFAFKGAPKRAGRLVWKSRGAKAMAEHVHDWRGGWACSGPHGCGAERRDGPVALDDAKRRIAELEAALRTIAERRAPGSDCDDWAEVDYAREQCDALGVPWSKKT